MRCEALGGKVESRAVSHYKNNACPSVGVLPKLPIVAVPNPITFCMYTYDRMQILRILHFEENLGMATCNPPCL